MCYKSWNYLHTSDLVVLALSSGVEHKRRRRIPPLAMYAKLVKMKIFGNVLLLKRLEGIHGQLKKISPLAHDFPKIQVVFHIGIMPQKVLVQAKLEY